MIHEKKELEKKSRIIGLVIESGSNDAHMNSKKITFDSDQEFDEEIKEQDADINDWDKNGEHEIGNDSEAKIKAHSDSRSDELILFIKSFCLYSLCLIMHLVLTLTAVVSSHSGSNPQWLLTHPSNILIAIVTLYSHLCIKNNYSTNNYHLLNLTVDR